MFLDHQVKERNINLVIPQGVRDQLLGVVDTIEKGKK